MKLGNAGQFRLPGWVQGSPKGHFGWGGGALGELWGLFGILFASGYGFQGVSVLGFGRLLGTVSRAQHRAGSYSIV